MRSISQRQLNIKLSVCQACAKQLKINKISHTFGIISAGGSVRFFLPTQKHRPIQMANNINKMTLPPDASKINGTCPE